MATVNEFREHNRTIAEQSVQTLNTIPAYVHGVWYTRMSGADVVFGLVLDGCVRMEGMELVHFLVGICDGVVVRSLQEAFKSRQLDAQAGNGSNK